MAVRSWCLMLKVATTALLNRLPATTARSKRAPTYKALTPKAAATATITFADGASYHTFKRPMMGNTSSTLVHPTLAIILFMAHLGDPLYLWLIDQVRCGASVESSRKRKTPPAGSGAAASRHKGLTSVLEQTIQRARLLALLAGLLVVRLPVLQERHVARQRRLARRDSVARQQRPAQSRLLGPQPRTPQQPMAPFPPTPWPRLVARTGAKDLGRLGTRRGPVPSQQPLVNRQQARRLGLVRV